MQRRRFLQILFAAAFARPRRARADASLRNEKTAPATPSRDGVALPRVSQDDAAEPAVPRSGPAARAPSPFTERGHLRAALARARAAGRALLVIVIPESDGEKYDRGGAFGELLDHGSDDQLAPLATAELVCAPADELRSVAAVDGEPLLAALWPGGRVTVAPADFPRGGAPRGRDPAVGSRGTPSPTERRIASLANSLRAVGLYPPPDRSKNLDGHRAAERLRARAPAGSHWARHVMCGYDEVDNLPDAEGQGMLDCGMGHVPEESARFLYFFSRPPRLRDGLTGR